jgi:hypothetical protein
MDGVLSKRLSTSARTEVPEVSSMVELRSE